MNQKNPFRLYNNLILVAVILAIGFLITIFIPGCKKDMEASEKNKVPTKSFFDLPANAPFAIKRVAAEFERQNRMTGFVKELVAQEGMPVWEKSIISYPTQKNTNTSGFGGGGFERSDTLVITPFVIPDSNMVSSFVVSRLNDTALLNLYRDNDYDRYAYGDIASDSTTADKIAFQLIILNEAVFGHRKYRVLDSLLFWKYY